MVPGSEGYLYASLLFPLIRYRDSGSYAEKPSESHLISLLGVFGSLGLLALEKDVILKVGLIGLNEKGPNRNSRQYLLGSLAPEFVFLVVVV